jgi:hypothetical protein
MWKLDINSLCWGGVLWKLKNWFVSYTQPIRSSLLNQGNFNWIDLSWTCWVPSCGITSCLWFLLTDLVGESGGKPMGLFPWALDIRSILADILLNCWTISSNNCCWLCWFCCCVSCYCFIPVIVSINCETLVPLAIFVQGTWLWYHL